MSSEAHIGHILEVDLTRRTASRRPTPPEWMRDYAGGRGLGIRLLWDFPPGIAPDAPENPLIFCPGLLNGYPTPGAPRTTLVTRSSLARPMVPRYEHSAALNYTKVGGFLGPELKYAEIDALVIHGRAERPTLLVIDPDGVRFEDATHLWGLESEPTERALHQRLGSEYTSAYIGPAGENRVRYAAIIHFGARVFGRGGGGFVMGSKKLKAIAIRGHTMPGVADYPGYRDAIDGLREHFRAQKGGPRYVEKRDYGTLMGFPWLAERSGCVVRNYREGYHDDLMDYHDRAKRHWVHECACHGCLVPCRKSSRIEDGPYPGRYPETSRFESVSMLGPNCGITDERIIPKLSKTCTDVGIDTITTGNILGFLMDVCERDLLPAELAREINLRWGDAAGMLALIDKIARREGVGDLLAEGLRVVAERIGDEVEPIAYHIKGLELPAWNPKGFWPMLLSLSTAARGACHLSGSWPNVQDNNTALDCYGICLFVYKITRLPIFAPLVAAVTGEPTTTEDLLRVGERTFTLERCYNLREGFCIRDDLNTPSGLEDEPLTEGPKAGKALPRKRFLKKMKQLNEKRGWDPATATPTDETLERLGLSFARPAPH